MRVGRGTRPPLSGEISARLAEAGQCLESAAEHGMIATSLRESGRGRLFGERTAGKALLHLPAPLEDGSVLLISTARLVRLDGEEILARGLSPDVEVAWPGSVHPPLDVPGRPADDPQLARALSWIRSGADGSPERATR